RALDLARTLQERCRDAEGSERRKEGQIERGFVEAIILRQKTESLEKELKEEKQMAHKAISSLAALRVTYTLMKTEWEKEQEKASRLADEIETLLEMNGTLKKQKKDAEQLSNRVVAENIELRAQCDALDVLLKEEKKYAQQARAERRESIDLCEMYRVALMKRQEMCAICLSKREDAEAAAPAASAAVSLAPPPGFETTAAAAAKPNASAAIDDAAAALVQFSLQQLAENEQQVCPPTRQ
ncbi:hypothetical protein PFISCL1PPCAC_17790, partial [Pristionchus fissidentatus]